MNDVSGYPIRASDHSWCCHPSGGDGDKSGEAAKLIAARDECLVLGEVDDAEADYSYHDYAIVQWGNKFYLLSTSGCSCPSPSETWWVDFGPGTMKQLRAHIVEDAKGSNYAMTKRQSDDFAAMCNQAERLSRKAKAAR